MNNFTKSFLLGSAIAVSSCASTNSFLAERQQVVEYYRIFNLPDSQLGRDTVINAARDGIAKSGVKVADTRPIPPRYKPAEPGRFVPVNPLAGSPMAALAAQSAAILKTASCEGAVWTAQTTRSVGSDNARLSFCIWEYQGGYSIDIYGNYILKEGGLSLERVAKAITDPLVGDFEKTLERLVNDVAREVQNASRVHIAYVEGYPEPSGESWWTQSHTITSK